MLLPSIAAMYSLGAINATYIAAFEETCVNLGGQVIKLETVKINCKPTSNYYNFTQFDYIPECVGLNCTENHIEEETEAFLDELLEANLAWAGKGRCTVDEGGTPFSGSVVASFVYVVHVGIIGFSAWFLL